MTEEEAKAWLATNFGADALARLESYVALLLAESERQSLIARSTFDAVWARHIVDSAQLLALAPSVGTWLDIGSGGGLPGLVVALLRYEPMVLCEPRRRRAEFLTNVAGQLECPHVDVLATNVADYEGSTPTIVSARAVAAVPSLLQWTTGLVSRETVFLLPRGRSAQSDLAGLAMEWHGQFHVEQSLTDPNAGIIVATQVVAR